MAINASEVTAEHEALAVSPLTQCLAGLRSIYGTAGAQHTIQGALPIHSNSLRQVNLDLAFLPCMPRSRSRAEGYWTSGYSSYISRQQGKSLLAAIQEVVRKPNVATSLAFRKAGNSVLHSRAYFTRPLVCLPHARVMTARKLAALDNSLQNIQASPSPQDDDPTAPSHSFLNNGVTSHRPYEDPSLIPVSEHKLRVYNPSSYAQGGSASQQREGIPRRHRKLNVLNRNCPALIRMQKATYRYHTTIPRLPSNSLLTYRRTNIQHLSTKKGKEKSLTEPPLEGAQGVPSFYPSPFAKSRSSHQRLLNLLHQKQQRLPPPLPQLPQGIETEQRRTRWIKDAKEMLKRLIGQVQRKRPEVLQYYNDSSGHHPSSRYNPSLSGLKLQSRTRNTASHSLHLNRKVGATYALQLRIATGQDPHHSNSASWTPSPWMDIQNDSSQTELKLQGDGSILCTDLKPTYE